MGRHVLPGMGNHAESVHTNRSKRSLPYTQGKKIPPGQAKNVARNAIRKTSLPSLGHVNPTKGADLQTPSFRLCCSQSA